MSEAIACDPAGPNAGLLCFEEPDDVLFGRRANGAIVNVPIAGLPNGDRAVLGGNDRVAVNSSSLAARCRPSARRTCSIGPINFWSVPALISAERG